jgi:hypothetical protein
MWPLQTKSGANRRDLRGRGTGDQDPQASVSKTHRGTASQSPVRFLNLSNMPLADLATLAPRLSLETAFRRASTTSSPLTGQEILARELESSRLSPDSSQVSQLLSAFQQRASVPTSALQTLHKRLKKLRGKICH